MSKSMQPSRLIRLVGADDSFIYFVAPSWSRSQLDHDINICKSTGVVLCSCEDACYRVKKPDLLGLLQGNQEDACKHVRGLVLAYRRLLGG